MGCPLYHGVLGGGWRPQPETLSVRGIKGASWPENPETSARRPGGLSREHVQQAPSHVMRTQLALVPW